jgi:hypothetical protein
VGIAKMSDTDFTLEKVEPIKRYRLSGEVYRKALNAVANKEVGWYKITIPDKKVATVYQQLSKIIKNHKDLKLHKIKDVVYIEKISLKK